MAHKVVGERPARRVAAEAQQECFVQSTPCKVLHVILRWRGAKALQLNVLYLVFALAVAVAARGEWRWWCDSVHR